MKFLIIKSIVALAILASLTACSSDSDTEPDAISSEIQDIVLTSQESVTCSDENSFSIEPVDGVSPDVTFLVNVTTGVTTITYKSTDGSATVVGCKKI